MTGTKPYGFLYILVSCIILSCGNEAEKKEAVPQVNFDALQEELGAVFKQNELIGMSLELIVKGENVWHGSYGLADNDRKIPVTRNTMYRIASISKTITATALLQLWEAGKVDLDTDVSTYLGWKLQHPEHIETPITLRQLLSHQSGIRDGEGYGKFSKSMISEKLDIQELFSVKGKYYTKDLFADHKPGAYFSYTNCTWGLIVSVIEKVSGERFDNYCRRHIFRPMKMKADFNASKIDPIDSLAVLYRFEEDKWKPQADDYKGEVPESRAYEGYQLGQNGLLFGPQGSLRSSPADLAKFSIMFMNDGTYGENQILKKETVDLMLNSQWLYEGENGDTWEDFFLSYGLGTHQTLNKDGGDIIFPDRKMVGHPGIAYGLLSDMYFEKDNNSGIVFITNGSKKKFEYGTNTSFYQVEEDVFKVIYPYLLQLENSPKLKKQN